MNYESMTKTRAKPIAERAWRYGCFKPDLYSYAGAYVHCPLCQERVYLPTLPPGRRAPHATDWSGAVYAHLLSAYDDERCANIISVRRGSEIK